MIDANRSTRAKGVRAAGAAVLLAALSACGSGGAEDTAAAKDEGPFYKGKTVDLVVPFEPGGGYDAYARALAPYLGECLGAQVVVKNEPGAGGLLATNATGAAGADDPRIMITNTVGAVSAQLAGAEGVRYDLSKMALVGRIAAPADSAGVGKDSPFTSFQQMIDSGKEVRFVATGPGSNEFITANLLSKIYDFPIKVITGFPGSGEARLAVISGDADAHVQSWDSQLKAIKSGDIKSVVLAGDEAVEALPGVPTVMDVEPKGENGQALRDSLVQLNNTGRGIVGPTGLPEGRVEELRTAFDCAVGKEQFKADMKEQKRPLDIEAGADWEKTVEGALNAPQEFKDIVKASF